MKTLWIAWFVTIIALTLSNKEAGQAGKITLNELNAVSNICATAPVQAKHLAQFCEPVEKTWN